MRERCVFIGCMVRIVGMDKWCVCVYTPSASHARGGIVNHRVDDDDARARASTPQSHPRVRHASTRTSDVNDGKSIVARARFVER